MKPTRRGRHSSPSQSPVALQLTMMFFAWEVTTNSPLWPLISPPPVTPACCIPISTAQINHKLKLFRQGFATIYIFLENLIKL
uniref:Uncharacterized protein n=1 Tax=Arundo donax TaxID=35708 RepID=A0A0A9E7K4_ARUDO